MIPGCCCVCKELSLSSPSHLPHQVFERGLKAVPLSVELWVHYLSFTIATFKEQPEPEELEEIRRLPTPHSLLLLNLLLLTQIHY